MMEVIDTIILVFHVIDPPQGTPRALDADESRRAAFCPVTQVVIDGISREQDPGRGINKYHLAGGMPGAFPGGHDPPAAKIKLLSVTKRQPLGLLRPGPDVRFRIICIVLFLPLPNPFRISPAVLNSAVIGERVPQIDLGGVVHRRVTGAGAGAHEDLVGGDANENAEITLAVLNGEKGPRRNAVLLNSAAGLYVAGRVDSLEDGIKLAEEVIDSGKALNQLERFIEVTNR